MRFTATIRLPELDVAAYKKSLDEAFQREIRNAARAWLRAMLTAELPIVNRGTGSSIGIPPVWTGTSRGTLMPLGRFLRIAIPINPLVKRSGRGPQVGANLGRFEFTNSGGRYSFRFSTSLAYMVRNEFYTSQFKLTHRTPWNGLKVGQKAFQDYCKNVMPKKIPSIASAIRYKTRIVR